MADQHHIAQLIAKLLRLEMTTGEQQELDAWLAESSANRQFFEDYVQLETILDGLRARDVLDKDAIWSDFQHSKKQLSTIAPFRRFWIAAAVVGFVAVGIFLIFRPHKAPTPQVAMGQKKMERSPSSLNRAQLTLADGTIIKLDTLKLGTVTTQDISQITLKDTNLLEYTRVTKGLSKAYNTLTVPYGARYKVRLSDGSLAFLNAGSTLHFPVAFPDTERVVELAGEAFFQVSKGLHPFKVKTPNQAVEVLGTGFAVRDYPNEQEQLTILETGKVKVSNTKGAITLKPGQEVRIDKRNGNKAISDANLENALSWKEGYFNFDGMDVKAAIWRLAQWYGKQVIFEKNIKKGSLGSGNIQQDIPLERLLKELELTDLHFEMRDSLTIVVKK